MPIIKSAKKRVKVARKATIRNNKTKRNLKSAIKNFQAAVAAKSKKSGDALREAQSALDTAAKKGLLHKNKVARKKKQLAAIAKAAKTGTGTSTAKKVVVKKPTVKRTVAKKTPAKKATTKKTAKK